MKECLYIITKYWGRHKKSLAALLFSGVLLCAVVCCAFLMIRQNLNRSLHANYDNCGSYDIALLAASEEFIASVSDADTLSGRMSVCGRMDVNGFCFEYGSLDDPHGLAHIPFESGGLPTAENEVAVDKGVLKMIGYAGKVGDHITLGDRELTLCGIISETYGSQRPTSISVMAEIDPPTYPIPLIYVAADDSSEYTFTMLDNSSVSAEELYRMAFDISGSSDGILLNDKDSVCEFASKFLVQRVMLIYIMSALAVAVAVLSVLAVTRSIFAERSASMQMLRRIGLSRRRLCSMYALECALLTVIQTVIGCLLGTAAHSLIYLFETRVLERTPYSGLTLDPLVTGNTADPYLMAALFSVCVIPIAYGLSALLDRIAPKSRKHKKAAPLRSCIARAFRQRAVSVIQVFALSLICLAAVLGYALYTDNGKQPMDGAGYMPVTFSEFGNGFSFEEDGLEEYYYATSPTVSQVGSFRFIHSSACQTGISDDTANRLEGAISTGKLENTFVITKTKHDRLKRSIVFGSDEERQFMLDNTADEYKSLFTDENYLYQMQTALADECTIGSLSDFVISGEINLAKLRSGEQVILMLASGDAPLNVGDSITLASAETENGYGLSGLVTADTTVGAIVRLNDPDKLLKYAVATGDDYGLLTTASGAKAMGLHGAAYTEIFAEKPLDGGLIPMSAGMELLSYSAEKRAVFIEKAMQYSSSVLIILLMSLLGFAAYFNGIGMKIRLKEYRISVMRAVGTPLKRLRRRLIIDSIKIPLLASAISFCGIRLLQHLTLGAYEKTLMLRDMMTQIPEGAEVMEYQLGINAQINKLNNTYFIDSEPWMVNALIPTLIIFAIMCAVTVLLTRRSFRMFTPDIAGSLAKGRKRR